MNINLIPPYGGTLVNTVVTDVKERQEILEQATYLPSLQLSQRSLLDLELIAVGAFSPLSSFMGEADYFSVLDDMRLTNKLIFPIPITLTINRPQDVPGKKDLILRNQHNEIVAKISITEVYKRDPIREMKNIFGTTDTLHPLIAEMTHWGTYAITGKIRVIKLQHHYDFTHIRHTPQQLRDILSSKKNLNVVAFQTRNPIHKAHETLTKLAATKTKATLLLHPTVGLTKKDDINYHTRVRTYEAIYQKYYDHAQTVLSLLPLAMRFAGPREAVWHAIIRRNYGANHFIVGRSHASPGKNALGKEFYEPLAAQKLALSVSKKIGVTILPFDEMVYVPKVKSYLEVSTLKKAQRFTAISGSKVRQDYLRTGKKLPSWFTHKETAAILSEAIPPSHKRGFCIWLTGLPSAGKSTIAEALSHKLLEFGRDATMLDGDVVRTHLSAGLGFSKEDRNRNILRIGFVASEIVRHNGAVICAAVSPYENARNTVRNWMPPNAFILIYVNTPLAVCETRDTKGYYQKARSGNLQGFTGIDDPYESPTNPEIIINTEITSTEVAVDKIVMCLQNLGFLKKHAAKI